MFENKREALTVKQIVNRGLGIASMALALAAALPTSASAAGALLPYPLHTSGSQIVDSGGNPVRICSVGWSWYGGRGSAPNSINTAGYKPMFQALVAQGINCVRICTCDQQVNTNPVITSINTSLNPDLAGLHYNQILQTMVNYGGSIGLKFIIESHNNEGQNTVNWGAQNPRGIWYDSGVPGGDGTDGGGNTATITNAGFLAIWQTRANLFKNNTSVIGYDLVNEPFYGTISWGDGNAATDIRKMYQDVGNAILTIDSAKLIICEGAQNYGAGWPEGDLTKVSSWPVSLNVGSRLVYSDHVYPTEVMGYSPDSGSTWNTRMTNEWGFLVKNGTAPVWIGECGDNMRTSDGTTNMNSFISYVNGHAAGGPTFSGNQQGISWSWWDLEGVQTSGVPNFGILTTGCNGVDATQQGYWNQMLSTVSSGTWDPNAWYSLICRTSGKAADCNNSMTAGTAIIQNTNQPTWWIQQWSIKSDGGGYYHIVNHNSGLALDCNGSTTAGTILVQKANNPGWWDQEWQIVSDGGGYYHLVCRTSNLAADCNGSTTAGTNLVQKANNAGWWDQEWQIVKD